MPGLGRFLDDSHCVRIYNGFHDGELHLRSSIPSNLTVSCPSLVSPQKLNFAQVACFLVDLGHLDSAHRMLAVGAASKERLTVGPIGRSEITAGGDMLGAQWKPSGQKLFDPIIRARSSFRQSVTRALPKSRTWNSFCVLTLAEQTHVP